MSNVFDGKSIKKLKLLVTIVDRSKGEFYLDVISQFDVNSQLVLAGLGTATSDLVDLLGLNRHKAVILSMVTDETCPKIVTHLEEKFRTVKNGKGIAFAVDFSSIIGVNAYQYLTNNRQGRGEGV